ncbi:MAG: ABC transporter permease [Candidatus Bathyarchaeota archaeon]|nr:ABC transporter permease [Candidatus Bathyarchaeota archaeon]
MTILSDVYSVLWADLQDLKRHWRSVVASSIVQPVLYLVVFGYGLGGGVSFEGIGYLAFVIPGIIALTSFSNSFNGVSTKLQVDRFFYKSFDELLLAPLSLYSIVFGKALVGVTRGLVSCVGIVIVGAVLSPEFLVSPLFVLVLFASCFVFAAFGVLIAFAIPSHGDTNTFNSLVMLPMTFLCGTFFSLNALPEAAKAALYALPLTHSCSCMRAAALGQVFPWWSFMVLLGFGGFFFLASVFVLKKTSI